MDIKYELKNAQERKRVNLKKYEKIIIEAIKSLPLFSGLNVYVNEKYFEIENIPPHTDLKYFQEIGKKIIEISQNLGSDLHNYKKQYNYSTQLFKRINFEDDDNDQIVNDNDDLIDDFDPINYQNIIVYSRDWTVETIVNQINRGNIILNPSFQRRNAWNDYKRSKLIESLIVGLPIPEIILAESINNKGKFIVVDGKQRLLTIAGFMFPEQFDYWDKPKLCSLNISKDYNGLSIQDFFTDQYKNIYDEISNSDIRCTVISNYTDEKILYHLFYRLNTGSVPLSMQELRQVLCPGPFANYLYEITEELQPIHEIMKLIGPDKRLRDIEFILKYLAFTLNGKNYSGNLKAFLDDFMREKNSNWGIGKKIIQDCYDKFNQGILNLKKIFNYDEIGRKFSVNKYENSLNKTLLEVQIYYFSQLDESYLTDEKSSEFKVSFESLCNDNNDFRNSIEYSTHRIDNIKPRFKLFQEIINKTFGINIDNIPIKI